MMRSFMFVTLGLVIALAGCQKQEPAKVTAGDVKEKVTEAAGTAADYAKQERDDYVGKIQKEMDEAKAELDKLKTKAKTATAKAKAKLDRDIKIADDKWRAAESRFNELKSASADAWKSLKAGVDKAVDELKRSFGKSTEGSK